MRKDVDQQDENTPVSRLPMYLPRLSACRVFTQISETSRVPVEPREDNVLMRKPPTRSGNVVYGKFKALSRKK
jgi:hypothetical protein